MKQLTVEEATKRLYEIANAEKIFIPYLTDNITKAVEMYNKIFAEEQVELYITRNRDRHFSPLDNYEVPKCPDCDIDMMIRVGGRDPETEILYKTVWYCLACGAEYYSDKTIEEWQNELPKRAKE
jgi:hypothetical protein